MVINFNIIYFHKSKKKNPNKQQQKNARTMKKLLKINRYKYKVISRK